MSASLFVSVTDGKMHLSATVRRNKKPGIPNCNTAHAARLFFQPGVGTLPSARHCSHVTPFLKANLLLLSVRNCDRGKLRSHALHVIGTAAALMEISALLAK